jgi:hypothetical protein
MYADVLADGLLDGVGAAAAPLSFGNRPLGPRVYRTEIGIHVLTIADNARNLTGLSATQLLPFATSYAANTDTMFNNVPTEPVSSPVVTITSPAANAWIRGDVNVTATVQDYAGLSSATLAVDSSDVLTVTTNLNAPIFPINTASYSEGAHSLTVTATNIVGLSTTANVGVRIDNTPPSFPTPSVSGTSGAEITVFSCSISGGVFDGVSGTTATLDASWGTGSSSPQIINNNYSFVAGLVPSAAYLVNGAYHFPLTLGTSDVAGNIASYSHTIELYCSSPGRGCLGWSCRLL